jgi:hypothetical protein
MISSAISVARYLPAMPPPIPFLKAGYPGRYALIAPMENSGERPDLLSLGDKDNINDNIISESNPMFWSISKFRQNMFRKRHWLKRKYPYDKLY